jgi:hypothetical protein
MVRGAVCDQLSGPLALHLAARQRRGVSLDLLLDQSSALEMRSRRLDRLLEHLGIGFASSLVETP